MRNKAITSMAVGTPAVTWELRGNSGFIGRKHLQAMRAAQAILSGVDTYDMTIYDSLNCGKLAGLIRYLRQPSC